jgi:ABC-type glycerol-3-phosphate transport system substrate-binding protein
MAASAAAPTKSETVRFYSASRGQDSSRPAIAADYRESTGNKVALVFDTAGATEQRFRAPIRKQLC